MVRAHLDAFDGLLCGWAWWQHSRRFDQLPFRPLLSRPHAEIIAGAPIRMRCSDETFELGFTPLPSGGETLIWAPPDLHAQTDVQLAGKGTAKVGRDERGLVRVVCPAGARGCTIVVKLTPLD